MKYSTCSEDYIDGEKHKPRWERTFQRPRSYRFE